MGRLVFIAVLMVVVTIANFASSEVATDPGVLKERSEDVQRMSPEELQNHQTQLKAIYANIQRYREHCDSSGALDRWWQHMQKMNKVTQPAI